MEIYYFTPDGMKRFEAELKRISDRVETEGLKAGAACQESAETWHDNFGFEDAKRQQAMWSHRLKEMVGVLRSAQVVDPAIDLISPMVGICRTVSIRNLDTDERLTYKIGSYMVFPEKEAVVREISYDSPIAQILGGATVGEIRSGLIDNKKHRFVVLKIE